MIPLFIFADSHWDPYTLDATGKYRSWFQWRASLMSGWTPWFDPAMQWHPGRTGFYVDTYAIYNNNPPNPTDPAVTHPEWIATDAAGNKLFIPWGCANGTCPQYAANIRHQGFIAQQIANIAATLKLGYQTIFFDDVNLELRTSDGNGNTVLPANCPNQATWAAAFVALIQTMRKTFPDKQIIHNSIWFSSAPQASIDAQIKAADLINCERGFGDPNLNPQSFQAFMSFIDLVHLLGRNVIQEEYTKDNLLFKIACFLLMYEPGDLFCCMNLFPDAWDAQMDIDFGTAAGPRYSVASSDGTVIWQRAFSKVTVSVDFVKRVGTVG